MKDKDKGVRSAAVIALGSMGPEAKAAIPVLIATLGDKDAGMLAANALAGIGPEAIPAIIDALKDIDREVREDAAGAFDYMGPVTGIWFSNASRSHWLSAASGSCPMKA